MLVDGLSAGLRALSFIALFQATGAMVFLACFGRRLVTTRSVVQRVALLSALIAIGILVLQYLLEAARMGGELASVIDPQLQTLAFHSPAARALVVRVVGLAVLIFALRVPGAAGTALGMMAAIIALVGFTLMGHTTSHSPRWLLALLLLAHVIVVAFWFGALVPLHLASSRENASIAGAVIDAFSKVAASIVPVLFGAGFVLAALLLGSVAGLLTTYGVLILVKVAGFALLMGLASLNKWRLGPAVAAGDARLSHAFRRCIEVEYALIAAVLSVTDVLTTFFSPD